MEACIGIPNVAVPKLVPFDRGTRNLCPEVSGANGNHGGRAFHKEEEILQTAPKEQRRGNNVNMGDYKMHRLPHHRRSTNVHKPDVRVCRKQ